LNKKSYLNGKNEKDIEKLDEIMSEMQTLTVIPT
jgi:hypothetical protein